MEVWKMDETEDRRRAITGDQHRTEKARLSGTSVRAIQLENE
jgi:hypothetical protein